MNRTGLPSEPSGTSGGWEQDKERGGTAKAGELSKAKPAIESDSKGGSDWVSVVSELIVDRGRFDGRGGDYRSKLEMLNLSQNRLDSIQGLKTLGGLIALNLGTQMGDP